MSSLHTHKLFTWGGKSWTIQDVLELKADHAIFDQFEGLRTSREFILKALQCNILKDTKHRYTLYCFLTFRKGAEREIVQWLKHIPLTSALDHGGKEEAFNLFLSMEGYRFFYPSDGSFPFPKNHDDFDAFSEGLAKRCPAAFGGKNRNHVEDRYEVPSHALILISTNHPLFSLHESGNSDEVRDFFIQKTASSGFSFGDELGEVLFEIGRRNPADDDGPPREWFGFRDGITNPRFFRDSETQKNLEGTNPDPLSPLNVVLRPSIPASDPFECGSFVVFLKLEQDPDAFKKLVEDFTRDLGFDIDNEDDKRKTAAYLMGRDYDGKPLSENFISTSHSNRNLNDFNYDQDAEGHVCPLNAHIRKANPRDDYEGSQIVRRGKIYSGKKKGMLFLSFQSRLQAFEDTINRGLYAFNYKHKHTGRDLLFVRKKQPYVGDSVYLNARGRWTPVPYLNVTENPVTFRGGQYFFAPSISFFRVNLENCL